MAPPSVELAPGGIITIHLRLIRSGSQRGNSVPLFAPHAHNVHKELTISPGIWFKIERIVNSDAADFIQI